ncbi:hypothetical protein [Flectobacillus sp. BAB-3569]|nr:hypothetical protein [Flectobacillus sp. BAB-3569]
MSTPIKLEWHVERIAWRDMIPYEHNPRKRYFSYNKNIDPKVIFNT